MKWTDWQKLTREQKQAWLDQIKAAYKKKTAKRTTGYAGGYLLCLFSGLAGGLPDDQAGLQRDRMNFFTAEALKDGIHGP